MDEQKIRRIIREEIARDHNSSRYRVNAIPNHSHNGVDSLRVRLEDTIPSASVVGSIQFSTIQTYTIQLNATFTPRNIQMYGIAVGVEGSSDPVRAIIIGSAQLTPTFYLQDPTAANTPDNFVVTGTLQFPYNGETGGNTPSGGSGIPAQTCAWFKAASVTGSDDYRAAVSEDHIVSIVYGGIIYARVTVTDFNKEYITLKVSYLEDGWSLTLNFVVT